MKIMILSGLNQDKKKRINRSITMLKKNALNDKQLDKVRGGLKVPYFDKTQELRA